MALVDQIDKLAWCWWCIRNRATSCPIDWDRISTIKLTPKGQVYTDIDSLETVRTAQQLGKAVIINNIDRLSLVPQEVSIDTTEEVVKDG
jgi:hypothetical protein